MPGLTDEPKFADVVRDRLKGQTLHRAQIPHCWYCWAITPWWDCHCPDATLVREGKLAKPKFVTRDGKRVVILPHRTKTKEVDMAKKKKGKGRGY
jgi:hypothetical protein